MALGDTGVGRSLNAGIVDTQFTHTTAAGTVYNLTAHYHTNGWTEASRNFTSLTGTFVASNSATRFHYNLTGDGTAAEAVGVWNPYRPLGWDAAAAQRTTDTLAAVLAYVAPAAVV
jgi:hypothetical protein